MEEKKKTILNKNEWKNLKTSTDELKNVLDVNNSILKSDPQLKARYDKVIDMYNNAVENKDLEMLGTVKDKLIEIFKEYTVCLFYELSKRKDFIDKQAANELIERGNNAIENNNLEEIEDIVVILIKLLRPSVFDNEYGYECVLEDPF